ncbi:MAG: class I adenylate-forming enzyme family protein [Candidatus Helarchaeota archaeon]
MGLGDLLKENAEFNPKRVAIIYKNKKITFRELNNRVNQLANAFLDLGLEHGEHVGILSYNRPEYIEIYNACFKIGAAAFGINYRYRENEIRHIINQSKAKLLIFEEDFYKRIMNTKENLIGVEKFISIGQNMFSNVMNYENLLKKYSIKEPVPKKPIKGSDKAFLIYTGGTTGTPKGAIWVHDSIERLFRGGGMSGFFEIFKSLFSRLYELPKSIRKKLFKQLLPLPLSLFRYVPISKRLGDWIIEKTTKKSDDPNARPSWLSRSMAKRLKAIYIAPLFHIKGFLMQVSLFSSSCLIFPDSKVFNPTEVLDLIEKHKINFLCFPGEKVAHDLINILKNNPNKYKLKSLIGVLSGGSVFSAESKKLWWEYAPDTIILDTIGSTENLIIPGVYLPGDELYSDRFDYVEGEMEIVDQVTREPVKVGEIGEARFKNRPMMKGYFNDNKKTQEVIDDEGWYYSGDLFQLLEDNRGKFIKFIGRIKEVIATGGEKVYPPEVEDVLNSHHMVYESVVIGVPDPEWGMSVLALVQLVNPEKASAELAIELQEYCKKQMASFKKPRYIEFVESFPTSMTGKIKRGELREKYKDFVKNKILKQ